jgi:hypothetical protein
MRQGTAKRERQEAQQAAPGGPIRQTKRLAPGAILGFNLKRMG